jgi:tripartite-type tricarboxylate transporter receptor subunit TctC
LSVPAGTPEAIVMRINQAVHQVLERAEVRAARLDPQ